MAAELPPWLDAEFLATALQGGENRGPPVKVTRFSASPAAPAGSNYFSRLYRIRLEYTREREELTTSLIVKAPFTKGFFKETGDTYDIYGKEIRMYKHILPKINVVLGTEVGPVSFYCPVDRALVLSDLKEQGYVMCDRFKQLDFSHCEIVLQALAKFHAASVACLRDNPDLIKIASKEILYNNSDRFAKEIAPFLETIINIALDIIRESGVDDGAVEMFQKTAESAGDSGVRLCKPKKDGMNVLNHGDLWCSNILFKQSTSGDILDIKFVDFQLSRYTSPVLDIIYFIWTSADEVVRESRIPDLCEIYRTALNSTLELLHCPERLTQQEFQQDFRNSFDWGIITICNLLPLVFCETEDIVNMEDTNVEDLTSGQEGNKIMKRYKGKQYRKHLPLIVQHFMAWTNTMR